MIISQSSTSESSSSRAFSRDQIEPVRPIGTVLLVTPYFPPHLGGVERYVFNLATSLLEHGRAERVVVVTTGLGGVVEGLVDGVPGLSVRLLDTGPMISATPLPRRWYRNLRRIILDENPDVVNAHAPVPLLCDVARLAAHDRPFVLTYHAGRLLKGHFLIDLPLRGYEAVVLRRTAATADAVICSSQYVRDDLGWRLPGEVSVIAPGVASEWLAPVQPPSSGRVAFVGTLKASTRYKGLDNLLAAVLLLRDRGTPVSLDVVGDGDDRERYKALVREAGLAELVTFHGARYGDELIRTYRDVCVVALPTSFDSTPTVLVEAMACGRPVVSSRVGGVPELVEHERNGLLVPPGDVPALADALGRLAHDPELAAEYGRQARTTVEQRYSWAQQSGSTAAVFQQAIQHHNAPASKQAVPTGRAASTGPAASTELAGPSKWVPPIKLAVVAAYYPPHIGGVETYAEQVVTAARDAPDLDVAVITTSPGHRTTVTMESGVAVVRLGSWLRISNTPFNPLWPLVVARLLRRHQVDVVNAHAPVPFLPEVALAVAGRRPTVLTYHSGTMVKGAHWADGLLGWYERRLLPRVFRRASALVAVSPTSLAAGGRAQLIHPGVDVDRFTPPTVQPAGPELLYVGRIERSSAWKGIGVLIRAFARLRRDLPQARLTLVGGGDAIAEHVLLAERLGVLNGIRFTGPLSGADVVAAYRQASVVVLPSLTAAESFGLALIEAMACGRPVIGSRVGGIPHVIDDGVTGLLVQPGDSAELAAACLRVLTDPQLAGRLGRAGRQAAVDRWSWAGSTAATLDLIRSVAGRPTLVAQPPDSRAESAGGPARPDVAVLGEPVG